MPHTPPDARPAAADAVLKMLGREAGVRVPRVAREMLLPAAFACVDAIAAGHDGRATRLVTDLWQTFAKPGSFAAGHGWADEPIYFDGDAVSRRDVATAMAADGVNPVGVALFVGTAQAAPWEELHACFAFNENQLRGAGGKWVAAGGGDAALPKSRKDKAAALAEPTASGTWLQKGGAKTLGEAHAKLGELPKGERVEHPSGAVGEMTRVRGKAAVKFPDQTLTLDQMGREAQHLKPSRNPARHTPHPPAGWHPGDNEPVPKGAHMGKYKTVGEARAALGRLTPGTKIITPYGRLGEVVNVAGPGRSVVGKGPRAFVPGVKVLGNDPTPLWKYDAKEIPHFRVITRNPDKQKLAAGSPARKSLGAKTAGEAMSALTKLPMGDRVLDHATGKVGTVVQVPEGGNGKIRMMLKGLKFDGEPKAKLLNSFTGDLVKSLEWIKPDLHPAEPESTAPPMGLVERIKDKVMNKLGAVARWVVTGGDTSGGRAHETRHTPEEMAVERYTKSKAERDAVRSKPKAARAKKATKATS